MNRKATLFLVVAIGIASVAVYGTSRKLL